MVGCPMTEFDDYAPDYADKINRGIHFSGKDHRFFTQLKADVLLEALGPLAQSGKLPDVLDVGCGTGAVHPLLAPGVNSVTGVDVSRASLDIAAAENPGNSYQEYEGGRLPFADGRFDAAIAICVVHHVPPAERATFFQELRRVVRVGGRILVIEHNPFNPLTLYVVNTCELDRNAVLVSAVGLRRLLAAANLTRPTVSYFTFLPFRNRLSSLVDRIFRPLPLGAQYLAVSEKDSD